MLLDLLKHHQGLFMAAIRPLIGARKCRDLAAMTAVCTHFRNILMGSEYLAALIKHRAKFTKLLHIINDIKVHYSKSSTIDRTIIKYNDNKLIVYYISKCDIRAYRGLEENMDALIFMPDEIEISGYLLRTYTKHIGNKRSYASRLQLCYQKYIYSRNEFPDWLYKCSKRFKLILGVSRTPGGFSEI